MCLKSPLVWNLPPKPAAHQIQNTRPPEFAATNPESRRLQLKILISSSPFVVCLSIKHMLMTAKQNAPYLPLINYPLWLLNSLLTNKVEEGSRPPQRMRKEKTRPEERDEFLFFLFFFSTKPCFHFPHRDSVSQNHERKPK